MTNDLLRRLPAIDKLLRTPPLSTLEGRIPRALLTTAAQQAVAETRREIQSGKAPDLAVGTIALRAAELAEAIRLPTLQPALNLTGTLLHTNLGRAPLSKAAQAAVAAAAQGYCTLEFDVATGERGHRDCHIEELLCRLTGAEAATVVNNNAGAVVIALSALAHGKEAIVSRGELIEIGGSFRIPEVMTASGVTLREVGTTNKTHLRDYAAAISAETGILLKVHTSNYRIVGFTADVAGEELATLGRAHRVPVLEDLGSGMLLDLTHLGLPREPTVAEAIAAGIDLVTFSGDKLLGGPQAGLIVGRSDLIDAIRHHPLMRALRCDKLTLAALEATLHHYLDPGEALREIPTLRMIAVTSQETKRRCRQLVRRLAPSLAGRAEISVVAESAAIGGGALPTTELPGYAVAIRPRSISVATFAQRLRQQRPPIVGRVRDDHLLLNPRTLLHNMESLVPGVTNALVEDE